jgi:hypothetical protein
MIKMPRNVVRFERLMYLYLAIAIAAVLLYPSADTQRHFARSATVTIVAFVAVTGLYVLGIWSVARWRKNWVRWAGVIGFVIGLPFGLKRPLKIIELIRGEVLQSSLKMSCRVSHSASSSPAMPDLGFGKIVRYTRGRSHSLQPRNLACRPACAEALRRPRLARPAGTRCWPRQILIRASSWC